MFILPEAFIDQKQRVVCAYPHFGIKRGLSAARYLRLLIDRMGNRPEDFGELQDEAFFVEKHIEDVSGRFILLKEDVNLESVREKLVKLSLVFFGNALDPKDHCFEARHELLKQVVLAP